MSRDVVVINSQLPGAICLTTCWQKNWTRGLYFRSADAAVRNSRSPAFRLERGDLVSSSDRSPSRRSRCQNRHDRRADHKTDFVVLGLAIFFGGVVGVFVTFPIGDMPISLSTSVGTLLAGLLVGHLRTRYPLFGRIPDGAITFMTSLGLAAFVGITGLHAGPVFLSALTEVGVGLLLEGWCGDVGAPDRRTGVRPPSLRMNPLLAPGGAGRRTDNDRSNGGRSGTLGQSRRRAGLHASRADRQHPTDDLGHDHSSRDRKLRRNCRFEKWPAAGSGDTKLKCLTELEVCNAETFAVRYLRDCQSSPSVCHCVGFSRHHHVPNGDGIGRRPDPSAQRDREDG